MTIPTTRNETARASAGDKLMRALDTSGDRMSSVQENHMAPLAAAHHALGDRCIAATAVSPSLAMEELDTAERAAGALGVQYIHVRTKEFEDARYLKTTCIAVISASTRYSPNSRRLPADSGFPRSPTEPTPTIAAITGPACARRKSSRCARRMELEVGDKPDAPCFASRLPYRSPVTVTAVRQIEAAERVVRELGCREVCVRHHGVRASVEVPFPEVVRLTALLNRVEAAFPPIAFTAVSVAPDGLRSGRFSAGLALLTDPAPASGGRRQ